MGEPKVVTRHTIDPHFFANSVLQYSSYELVETLYMFAVTLMECVGKILI